MERERVRKLSLSEIGDERETLCQVGIGTCLIPTHAQWRVTGQVHAPRQAATTVRGLGKTGANALTPSLIFVYTPRLKCKEKVKVHVDIQICEKS